MLYSALTLFQAPLGLHLKMSDERKESASPAAFIREQLDARGMTQLDLAFVLGTNQQTVNHLAVGKRGVSAEMAKALGAAFDVPAAHILEMQKASELRAELERAKQPDASIARKARLMQTYPVREMIKRGWVDDDPKTLEAQVARFFGCSSVEDLPHLPRDMAHAAKKVSYWEQIPPPQFAWLLRVKQIADRLIVPVYSEAALRESLPKLRALMDRPESASRVPRIMQECGVRLVVVENLPGGKIDGVCFWTAGDASPVIGLSLRFDRIDNFWFVLRHEIEHVMRRDGVSTINVDTDICSESEEDRGLPECERSANDAASDFMVPRSKIESWIARKAPFYPERDLLAFATLQGVHAGIVAGQVRYRTKKFRLFKEHLVKIRSAVLATAVVDGWGDTYPTQDGE